MSSSGFALHIDRAFAITQPVMPSPIVMRRREKSSASSPTACAATALPERSSTRNITQRVERNDRAQLVRDERDGVAQIE